MLNFKHIFNLLAKSACGFFIATAVCSSPAFAIDIVRSKASDSNFETKIIRSGKRNVGCAVVNRTSDPKIFLASLFNNSYSSITIIASQFGIRPKKSLQIVMTVASDQYTIESFVDNELITFDLQNSLLTLATKNPVTINNVEISATVFADLKRQISRCKSQAK